MSCLARKAARMEWAAGVSDSRAHAAAALFVSRNVPAALAKPRVVYPGAVPAAAHWAPSVVLQFPFPGGLTGGANSSIKRGLLVPLRGNRLAQARSLSGGGSNLPFRLLPWLSLDIGPLPIAVCSYMNQSSGPSVRTCSR